MKEEKERRLASVYIGAVGSEIETGACVDSVRHINIRAGDSALHITRATKGYEARQGHVERFLKSNHGAILLLDADMYFQPDTLERLRSHGLPYVSGYYMRRSHIPVAPVMFEKCPQDVWPMMPVTRVITDMEPLGASGWGCVLIHREVFDAVAPILKGEEHVIEDDMDVWPYDLDEMMRIINRIKKLTHKRKQGPDDRKELKKLSKSLKQEFRPLRGTKDVVGSDLRFPYYAAAAGYDMLLDPEVAPGHNLNYPLYPSDYVQVEKVNDKMKEGLIKKITDARVAHTERMRELK